MTISILEYLTSLRNPEGLFRTLHNVKLCCDKCGEPILSVGNSAVVFKIEVDGEVRMLKCYTRRKPCLKAIYREKLLTRELFVFPTDEQLNGKWCDVVIDKWYDGCSLERSMCNSKHDPQRLALLADEFDRTAVWLLNQPWAHGDLKPDNIIVDSHGGMHLIDMDAMYRPEFGDEMCDETGTRAYQHPRRDCSVFDKSIDDYPIALLSTTLHAFALNMPAYKQFYDADGTIISPTEAVAGTSPALAMIERMLALNGDFVRYRIARLLRSPQIKLPRLGELLNYALSSHEPYGAPLTATMYGDLWGYDDEATGNQIIPPLFESAFDFSDGLAAVCSGEVWHFIDTTGRAVISCADAVSVKPFRNGFATKITAHGRITIDRTGKEIEAL